MKVSEEDIHKTAFVTPDGHWEFLRVPFGMAKTGTTLKREMNRIIGDMDSCFFTTGRHSRPHEKIL